MICWRCREKVDGPVCVSCGAVQPPPAEPDLFTVLGLERAWSLTPRDVDVAWRDRSRKIHPDRFAGKSAVERRMSLQWTAAINAARGVLRDPVRRGWYLATGQGRPREEGSAQLDPDFLEEVFELQMESRTDPEGVAARASAMRDDVLAAVDVAMKTWEEGDKAAPPDGVEELLGRVKYLENLAQPDAT